MTRNLAAWGLRLALPVLGLALLAAYPAHAEGDTTTDGQRICGGVFGLRDWTKWRSGWGSHDDPCDIAESCVSGVLTLTLPFTPQGTGFISADTDEHLLAQGIHAGVSLGPRVAKVSFWREVIRRTRVGYALVSQRVSCRDRAFRDRLANVWVVWVVRP